MTGKRRHLFTDSMPHYSPTGYVAAYDRSGSAAEDWSPRRPVISWDEDGDALVVDHRRGRLVPARTFTGFEGLEFVGQAIGVIDGGGWKVRFFGDEEASNDRKSFTGVDHIVAWTITSKGEAHPFITPGHSETDARDMRDFGGKHTFVAPDGTEIDAGNILDKIMKWCGECQASGRRYVFNAEQNREVPCPACHPDHPDHGGVAPDEATS